MPSDGDEREQLLAQFEAGRLAFEAGYAGVPDEALAFLAAGDDYAFGGLVIHAAEVLIHYDEVLRRIGEADYGEVRLEPDAEYERLKNERIRAGLTYGDRAEAFATLRSKHTALAERVRRVEDLERKAPVYYSPGDAEPYPTSAADVMGWVIGHYDEHVPQISDLLERWRTERG